MRRPIFTIFSSLAVTAVGLAFGQEIPPALEAPAGQQLYLKVHAEGYQIYVCKNDSRQFAWTLKAPEAELRDAAGKSFGKHFAGPTWQANDGSSVTGTLVAKADSDDREAIPWLLLNVTGHQGNGILSRAKTVQRIHTKGGKAPAGGCDAQHLDQEQRVPYSADYHFYAAK
jgi:hypothetical protein